MDHAMYGRKLIFVGSLLFLFGLLQGALIPYFLNPRMALSAHLAAVQSGMALIIFGVIWRYLMLSPLNLIITFYSVSLGMFIVWLSITLGAVVGASKALPIAGAGFASTPAWELVVEVLVTLGAGLGVIGTALLVFGLWRGLKVNA